MSFPASTSREDAGSLSRHGRNEGARPDALQPLLAGAHARGMADALELAGVAAVMIDAHGMVLHAGTSASALFGPDLRVEFDHLVGADGEATRAIQILITQALEGAATLAPVRLARGQGRPLVLHARRVPGAAQNICQLLKLLIIIEESLEDPSVRTVS